MYVSLSSESSTFWCNDSTIWPNRAAAESRVVNSRPRVRLFIMLLSWMGYYVKTVWSTCRLTGYALTKARVAIYWQLIVECVVSLVEGHPCC